MSAPIAFSACFYALIGVFTYYITRNRSDDYEAPDERGDGDIFLAQELRRHRLGPSPDHTESCVHHARGNRS